LGTARRGPLREETDKAAVGRKGKGGILWGPSLVYLGQKNSEGSFRDRKRDGGGESQKGLSCSKGRVKLSKKFGMARRNRRYPSRSTERG